MPSSARQHFPVDRRSFLLAGGLSCFGANLAGPAMALADSAVSPTGSERRKIAKSAIMICCRGSVSHRHVGHEPDGPGDPSIPHCFGVVESFRFQQNRRAADRVFDSAGSVC